MEIFSYSSENLAVTHKDNFFSVFLDSVLICISDGQYNFMNNSFPFSRASCSRRFSRLHSEVRISLFSFHLALQADANYQLSSYLFLGMLISI